MKKLHLLVGVFIFIGCLQVHAEKNRVAMEKWQTGNVVAQKSYWTLGACCNDDFTLEGNLDTFHQYICFCQKCPCI